MVVPRVLRVLLVTPLLLALLPSARRARLLEALPLAAFTPHTITHRDALEKALRRIRRERLATDDQEYLAGLVCVAVPVQTPAGRVVASVAVHAPMARMSLAGALRHVPRLQEAAVALGRTFAAVPPASPHGARATRAR